MNSYLRIHRLFAIQPVFETDVLLVRQMEASDADDYFAFAASPIVTAQTTWEAHAAIDDSIRYIGKARSRYEAKEECHWGIVYKPTGKLIGRTGLIRIEPDHAKAELGYVLSHEYWGRGFVSEATKQVMNYAFVELGFNRIEARCNINNIGSYRVMEKLGMKLEGILRQQLRIKGEFVDQRIYSILQGEWNNWRGIR